MAQIPLRSVNTRSVVDLVQEIRKFPRITNTEARKLAELAHQGNEKARERLINSSMWYVIQMALQLNNKVPSAALEDLIQDGNYGLITAVDNYDPTSRAGWLTYAYFYAHGSMTVGLSDSLNLIRMPKDTQKLMQMIEETEDKYIQEYGVHPSLEELMEVTGLSRKKIIALADSDVETFDYEDPRLSEWLLADYGDNTHAKIDKEEFFFVIKKLGGRERYIITKLFGLDGDEMSMSEIADNLHITSERVRQIKNEAIDIIRQQYKR